VDERSAGFFALGIIQATQKPVAICCTSGTAVLNLGPAIAEAYYQQLPLLAISADRPAAWIGQMDGQTIPQPDRFQGITRYSAQLPIIHNSEDEWYCNRLINEAILALDNRVKGPVHINIPLAEPLFNFKQKSFRKYGLSAIPQSTILWIHPMGTSDASIPFPNE
jgi:2-succinyl-5-enolpyruvyl-6-hydroxy-3-cyclohexene-1-carboxylate synthase